MDCYWEVKEQSGRWHEQIYLGIVIVWAMVSWGLSVMEQTGCVFGLTPILQCKVLAVAIVFAGRCFLFPRYRLGAAVPWMGGILFLLIGGTGMVRVGKLLHWGYAGLVLVDTFLWAVIFTWLLETCCALFAHWFKTFTVVNYDNLAEQWQASWSDSIKLAIWLTLVLGLSFFYMVNFYQLDVIFYSRLFTLLLIGVELGGLAMCHGLCRARLHSELELIDRELTTYLKWRSLDPEAFAVVLPGFQYLFLTRQVLAKLSRPVVAPQGVAVWLCCSGFLANLPQLIGIVMKV